MLYSNDQNSTVHSHRLVPGRRHHKASTISKEAKLYPGPEVSSALSACALSMLEGSNSAAVLLQARPIYRAL